MQKAVDQTGLDDFGAEDFRQPLELLARSLDGESHLTPIGRMLSRQHLINLLTNRLLLEREWRENPQILSRRITAPIVIVGLPRSGTTLLQHLMGTDPAMRPLWHWETLFPVSPRDQEESSAEERIKRAERSFRLFYWMAPQAQAIHPQSAQSPTECVGLFAHSFGSVEFAAVHRLPSYLEWWLSADLRGHYEYYLKQLQLLDVEGKTWMLKSPGHLFSLDQLISVVPDVRIIQLHRDPLDVLPSYCSLAAVLRGVNSEHIDLNEIGRVWLEAWAIALERALEHRRLFDPDRIVDLSYSTLVRDPLAAVQAIYEKFGLAFAAETKERMTDHLMRNPQHRHGRHQYSLEQFGLDNDQVMRRFGGYMETFLASEAGSR